MNAYGMNTYKHLFVATTLALSAGCASSQLPPPAPTEKPAYRSVEAAQTAADFSFDGCNIAQRAETTWEMVCDDIELNYNVGSRPESLQTSLERYLEANRGGSPEFRSRSIEIDAKKSSSFPGRRYVNAYPQMSDGIGLVAGKRDGQQTTIAVCQYTRTQNEQTDEREARCRGALRSLLEHGVPQVLLAKAKAPAVDERSLAGRKLETPSDCVSNHPTNINCGAGGQLSWKNASTTPTPISKMMNGLQAKLEHTATQSGSTLSEARWVGCKVDGVEAKCRQHTLDIPGNTVVQFFTTSTTVRGEEVFVMCSYEEPAPAGEPRAPRPCNMVLSFD